MAAVALLARPERRTRLRVCFTCDEEIGKGVDHVDLEKLGAHVGYTLDGSGVGEIDIETFSADLPSSPSTARTSTRPSRRAAWSTRSSCAADLVRLPRVALSPETTEEREGFLHPYRIEGGVDRTVIQILCATSTLEARRAGRAGRGGADSSGREPARALRCRSRSSTATWGAA